MVHELKTWSEYYNQIFMGHKTFEVRKNDRNFIIGDTLILIEGDLDLTNSDNPFIPTGRTLARRVTSILYGGQFGIQFGYVVMSIQ